MVSLEIIRQFYIQSLSLMRWISIIRNRYYVYKVLLEGEVVRFKVFLIGYVTILCYFDVQSCARIPAYFSWSRRMLKSTYRATKNDVLVLPDI